MKFRRATIEDVPSIVETTTQAFLTDPTWSYIFDDPVMRPAHYRRWWRLWVEGALRYDTTWLADDGAAAAVWIPPGGTELSEDQASLVEPMLRSMQGERADFTLSALARFDAAYPQGEPHYSLTLLGTRTDRRGEGLGMALLRHSLDMWDVEGLPCYLESSNPANDRRYEKVGFIRTGEFQLPGGADAPVVGTMWRPAADR